MAASMAGPGRLIFGVCVLSCIAPLLQICLASNPKMCSSLDSFVSNTNRNVTQCERDQNCSIVSCVVSDNLISMVIMSSKTRFLPCLVPPSISISFIRPDGSLFSSHIVNRTTILDLLTIPITSTMDINLSLHINLTHSLNCLEVETDIVQVVAGESSMTPLNGLTSIMLDPSMCPGTESTDTSPSTTEDEVGTDVVMATSRSSTLSNSLMLRFAVLLIPVLLLKFWIHR